MLSCLTAASGPAGARHIPSQCTHHTTSALLNARTKLRSCRVSPHPAQQSRSQQELLCQPELCSAPAEGIAVQGSMEMQCLEGLSIPVSPPSSGVEHFISMEHPTKMRFASPTSPSSHWFPQPRSEQWQQHLQQGHRHPHPPVTSPICGKAFQGHITSKFQFSPNITKQIPLSRSESHPWNPH